MALTSEELHALSNLLPSLLLLFVLSCIASAVIHFRPSLQSFELQKLRSSLHKELQTWYSKVSTLAMRNTNNLLKLVEDLWCNSLQVAGTAANVFLGSLRDLSKSLQVAGNAAICLCKRTKKDPADDLICPITRELPWVPVIAADGRTYEKEAIETYFKTQREKGLTVKSVITNEPMSDTLIPAPHIKSLIVTLIENQAIQGDVVEFWHEKAQQVKQKESLLQRANDGDSEAMYAVAVYCKGGIKGFQKDPQLACEWYRKSHEAGNVKGTAGLGVAFVKGSTITKSQQLGIHYLTVAATAGSDFAALELGLAFANGRIGVPVNEKEAIFWLQKSLGVCTHSHMAKDLTLNAQKLLDKLLKIQNTEKKA
ncbi:SAM and U-box domain-containing protein 1 [Seminavis robusta]|uniref:SAM and U-box domain-containing protein 1 n=1 Tax=Seminavis robusta TaxID=568900 RepID=A0A9N8HL93_9STRA|nr:SAM and U-box domain-containing protein 1 [Seminavis robusta]|eukprot:Sro1011_g231050.1 SAM and U-box domain-containing protein 1 (368) ;mRNA; f:20436-21539